MLSSLSREAINAVFSGVSIPAIIKLSITVLISAFNIYVRSSSSF